MPVGGPPQKLFLIIGFAEPWAEEKRRGRKGEKKRLVSTLWTAL